MAQIPEAYIYEAIRTPRGRGKADRVAARGQADLAGRRPDPRAAAALPGARPGARSTTSCSAWSRRSATRAAVIARTAALAAGLPDTVAGVQLNRFCASGLEAVNIAAQKVRSGLEDLVLAGGVESMSRVPMGSRRRRLGDGPGDRLRHRLRPAGHRRRPDRHPGGLHPHGRRHLRRRVADPRRQGVGERLLRAARSCPVRDRNGLAVLERDEHLRAGATLEALAGAEAVVRRRSARRAGSTPWRCSATTGSSGSTTSTTPATPRASWTARRWCWSAAEAAGAAAGLTPARPDRLGRAGGLRPDDHAHRPGAGQPQGAGQGRADGRRHRPVRDQRGLRRGGAAVHARPGRSRTRRSTSTAARSPWAIRWAPPGR